MTGREWVQHALEEIGVLGEGETVSDDDAETSLRKGNLLIDELFLDRQWLHMVSRVTKTLTASVASYTIGAGGSINTVRPTWIDSAYLVMDTGASEPTETPIAVLTDQQWQGIAQKGLESGLSQAIYYDHGWTAGLGLIYPWPIPNVGTTQLVLNLPSVAVTEFADLTTDYTFPVGYKAALVANLAIRLSTPYGATPSGELQQRAVMTLAKVKRGNNRLLELRGERIQPGGRGGYNIRTNH